MIANYINYKLKLKAGQTIFLNYVKPMNKFLEGPRPDVCLAKKHLQNNQVLKLNYYQFFILNTMIPLEFIQSMLVVIYWSNTKSYVIINNSWLYNCEFNLFISLIVF